MRRKYLAPLWALPILLVAVGCGPSTGTVEGKVMIDGEPLPNGLIMFVSKDGQGQPTNGVITDGKYKVETTVGDKTVQISSMEVDGQTRQYNSPDAPMMDVTKEIVAPEFNARTTLSLSVAGGSQSEDFTVTRIKRKR